MNMSVVAYAALAVLAGALIPVMAKMNASLAGAYGSIPVAAFILLLVGTLAAGAVLAVSGAKLPSALPTVPVGLYFAGLVVAFYVLSVTFLVPRFGMGNTIMFVVGAQVISAALIDHFGILNAPISPITLERLAGIGLIFIGVYWAKS
jgi:bacterial/archaeal transporter family-2 protein